VSSPPTYTPSCWSHNPFSSAFSAEFFLFLFHALPEGCHRNVEAGFCWSRQEAPLLKFLLNILFLVLIFSPPLFAKFTNPTLGLRNRLRLSPSFVVIPPNLVFCLVSPPHVLLFPGTRFFSAGTPFELLPHLTFPQSVPYLHSSPPPLSDPGPSLRPVILRLCEGRRYREWFPPRPLPDISAPHSPLSGCPCLEHLMIL